MSSFFFNTSSNVKASGGKINLSGTGVPLAATTTSLSPGFSVLLHSYTFGGSQDRNLYPTMAGGELCAGECAMHYPHEANYLDQRPHMGHVEDRPVTCCSLVACCAI